MYTLQKKRFLSTSSPHYFLTVEKGYRFFLNIEIFESEYVLIF